MLQFPPWGGCKLFLQFVLEDFNFYRVLKLHPVPHRHSRLLGFFFLNLVNIVCNWFNSIRLVAHAARWIVFILVMERMFHFVLFSLCLFNADWAAINCPELQARQQQKVPGDANFQAQAKGFSIPFRSESSPAQKENVCIRVGKGRR